MTVRLELDSSIHDDSWVAFEWHVPMTVVLDVCSALIPVVVASNDRLERDALRFFIREGLQLGHRVLPVELATLLLPLIVGLHLLLLSVGISKRLDFIESVLALSLRLLRQLNQLFDFCTDRTVLPRDHFLYLVNLTLDAVADLVDFVFDGLLFVNPLVTWPRCWLPF